MTTRWVEIKFDSALKFNPSIGLTQNWGKLWQKLNIFREGAWGGGGRGEGGKANGHTRLCYFIKSFVVLLLSVRLVRLTICFITMIHSQGENSLKPEKKIYIYI